MGPRGPLLHPIWLIRSGYKKSLTLIISPDLAWYINASFSMPLRLGIQSAIFTPAYLLTRLQLPEYPHH